MRKVRHSFKVRMLSIITAFACSRDSTIWMCLLLEMRNPSCTSSILKLNSHWRNPPTHIEAVRSDERPLEKELDLLFINLQVLSTKTRLLDTISDDCSVADRAPCQSLESMTIVERRSLEKPVVNYCSMFNERAIGISIIAQGSTREAILCQ